MKHVWPFPLFVLAGGLALASGDEPVVFRSDVSLVRVDAQVLDRNNRAITGLHAADFVVREDGQPQPIRNFASEEMPVDVLLLLDVSTSMRPHVQRMADGASDALRVLGDQDRIAIMVFDRSTRVRMSFRSSRSDTTRELDSLLQHESFNGGTDITLALLDAARYIGREGRRDARRAIVILTDDQTERSRDEAAVNRALTKADAVLSALIAPDAMAGRYGRQGQGGNGPYDDDPGANGPMGTGGGSGGGIGGSLGGIILGRRGPYGGNGPTGGGRQPGGTMGGSRTRSAGTSEIARNSGGDSMSVDGALAFQDTLTRLRQRYALYFNLPAGVKPGQERNIDVLLAGAALRRYSDAEVRFRRVYMAPGGGSGESTGPVVVSRGSAPSSSSSDESSDPDQPRLRRRPAVNQVSDEPSGPNPSLTTQTPAGTTSSADDTSTAPNRGTWRKAVEGDTETKADAKTEAQSEDKAESKSGAKSDATAGTTDAQPGGWRKLKPGEQP
jgi:VWFA-related protein